MSLPPGAAVSFGTEEATATVSGLSKEPGQAVELTVRFAKAEPLTFRTVIVPAADDYASITPPASPTPTSPTETPASRRRRDRVPRAVGVAGLSAQGSNL